MPSLCHLHFFYKIPLPANSFFLDVKIGLLVDKKRLPLPAFSWGTAVFFKEIKAKYNFLKNNKINKNNQFIIT